MGFEFKILVQLATDDKEKIARLIRSNEDNDTFGDEVEFEDDGIYVCKYNTSDLWTGLEQLKDFLDKKKIDYIIEEL